MSSAPTNQVSSHWKGRSAARQSPNLFSKIFFKKSTWRKDGFAVSPLKPHLTIFSMVGSLFLIIIHPLKIMHWNGEVEPKLLPPLHLRFLIPHFIPCTHEFTILSSTPHGRLSSFLSSIRNKFTWMETIYSFFVFYLIKTIYPNLAGLHSHILSLGMESTLTSIFLAASYTTLCPYLK